MLPSVSEEGAVLSDKWDMAGGWRVKYRTGPRPVQGDRSLEERAEVMGEAQGRK